MNEQKLVLAMGILWEFSEDFSLEISGDKSLLWGTSPERLRLIAQQWGIGVKDTVTALGMDWADVQTCGARVPQRKG